MEEGGGGSEAGSAGAGAAGGAAPESSEEEVVIGSDKGVVNRVAIGKGLEASNRLITGELLPQRIDI